MTTLEIIRGQPSSRSQRVFHGLGVVLGVPLLSMVILATMAVAVAAASVYWLFQAISGIVVEAFRTNQRVELEEKGDTGITLRK